MNAFMQICTYALAGVFAQNLVFTSGVAAERALRIPYRRGRILIATGAVTFFSLISAAAMYGIRQLAGKAPVLERIRVLLLVILLAAVYLAVLALCRRIPSKAREFKSIAEALPSGVFNTAVIMVGVTSQILSLSLAQSLGFALGSGLGFLLATLLVQEAIDRVENPAMPAPFVGLPSLLIYIGILAMAFIGFTGGPPIFL